MSDSVVFVVGGDAGSYENAHEWTIAAYESADDASVVVAQLIEAASKYGSKLRHDDREKVVNFFVKRGLSAESIPYGDLEDVRFYSYPIPLIRRRP